MYLLAFESSCDDTSVALLRNEELISMRTHTQIEHIATQGVVPEVAARLHANHIFGLIDEVLAEANITISDIDIFAATSEPGLVPSLLIGKTVAKTLAISHKKPLIWVNHIEGHVFSLLLERKLEEIEFPVIVLSASGGHNDLFLWNKAPLPPDSPLRRGAEEKDKNWGVGQMGGRKSEQKMGGGAAEVWKDETMSFDFEIKKIGGTTDDSAGESMDKVGRSLGLPFPAGRHIDELAQKYDPKIHTNIPRFPLVMPADSFGFSFSGLKSAAIREIQLRASLLQTQTPTLERLGKFELGQSPSFGGVGGASGILSEVDLIEISYGYQETITKILSERLIEAFKKTGAKSMALVGGVSANSRLRGIMEKYSKENNIPYYTPKSLKYCGDNAAMIGIRAYYEYLTNNNLY